MAPRSGLHLPRRTVRLRLTALYGGLFLISGAVLLAITYGLVVGRPVITAFRIVGSSGGVVKAVAGQAKGGAVQDLHGPSPTVPTTRKTGKPAIGRWAILGYPRSTAR